MSKQALWLRACSPAFSQSARKKPAVTRRTGHPRPNVCVQGRGKEAQPTFHLVARLCLRATTASPLWSVDIGIYVQFYLCSILLFRRKNATRTQKVWGRGVSAGWLAFDHLFEWKVINCVGCSRGGFVFCFCFLNKSLHPLPAVNPSLWGGGRKYCIAVCKLFLLFFYYNY